MLFGLALLATRVHAEDWAPGETIEKALFADVTPEGFNAVAAVIPALIPANIDIPPIAQGGTVFGLCDYGVTLDNGVAHVEVVSATITPGNGVLDVTANLLVSINDAANPFDFGYEYCFGDDNCGGYVDAFAVTVTTTMALDVVDDGAGGRALDATIGEIEVSYGLEGDDIHFDCWFQGIEDFLDYVGLSFYGLLIDQLDSTLRSAIADIGPTLETTIEDAFASASIEQDLALNGAVAHLSLQPADVDITPAGTRIQLSASLDGEPAACISAFDPGGSRKTPTQPPDIGVTPSGVGADYHIALTLSDDFTNQALYALWRGGLLCYAIEPGGSIPLDTSILNLLTGDAFEELFPPDETQPISIVTAPKAPPTTTFDGDHAIDVAIDRLGLQVYAELDGRQARMITVDLTGTVGADLDFDGTTGALGVVVDLDPAALTPSIGYNEFFPAANDTILASFSGAFSGLLDTVVGGLLDNLSFALPAFSGIGLTELQTAPVGDNSDWLGAYSWVGPVSYAAAEGCGSDGGCGGGCSGGCDTANPAGPAFWGGIAGFLLLRRRR